MRPLNLLITILVATGLLVFVVWVPTHISVLLWTSLVVFGIAAATMVASAAGLIGTTSIDG
jgi:hypothetical protein